MENLSKRLGFRALSQIDQKYMEDALEFLEEYELIENYNNLKVEPKLDYSCIRLEDFKEWLMIAGSLDSEIDLAGSEKHIVSFTVALTKFELSSKKALTIARLRNQLEESEASYYGCLIDIHDSLILLNKLANR